MLLCWEFSRLARDSEDLGWIRNRLRVAQKTAVEVTTGLDAFNVGSKVMGVFAEEYLVKLSADSHRGMRGRVERGFAAGGAPYGYRLEKAETDGPSCYVVVEEAAAVVRRIFEDYAKGASLRELAFTLNRERIAPPRPRALKGRPPSWSVTALRSMLLNPLYRGELLWNRSKWIKDHETGRRRRFERPEIEWVRSALPPPVIVEPETWEAAVRTLRQRGRAYFQRPRGEGAGRKTGPPRRLASAQGKHVLSGLCECAECGGGFHSLQTTATWGCGWRQKRGPDVCSNVVRVPRADLEGRVFGAIRDRILVPEHVVYFVEGMLEQSRLLVEDVDPGALRKRLREIETELASLARFAARTGRVDEAVALNAELEAEREGLEEQLATAGGPVDLDRYRPQLEAQVNDLRAAVLTAGEGGRRALTGLLRGRRMTVAPDPERGFVVAGIFELALEMTPARNPVDFRAGARVGSGGGI